MNYKLKNLDTILQHWPVIAWVLHDQADKNLDKTNLDALVSSEDYFALLATRLDQVATSLSKKQSSDYLILEHSIKELLYLHQAYEIKRRSV